MPDEQRQAAFERRGPGPVVCYRCALAFVAAALDFSTFYIMFCLSPSTCLPAGMADADDGELTESNALAREAYREKQAALREKIAEAKRARERLQDLSKRLVELKHEKFRAFMDVSAAALPLHFGAK